MSDDFGERAVPPALRRKQLLIAAVLGAVIVVGVVVAVVLSVTLPDKSTDPTSPQDAARQWATAVLAHDTSRQDDLQCVNNHSAAGVLKLVVATSTALRVGTPVPIGSSRWTVPVVVDGSTFSVPVQEQSDRYLVC